MKKVNRREFFRGSLATSALVAVSPGRGFSTLLPEKTAGTSLKISVLSYAFHGLLRSGEMDVFGYMESCKYRFGLNAADIWNGFLPSVEEDFIKKVKAGLDERELALADLCVDQAHVWDDDEELREKNYQNALAHLNVARLLGAGFVRIDAGSRDEQWTEEMFDHIVKRFKEYTQYAFDHGFRVGAENHWGPEKDWQQTKKLIEAVDHPAFKISCHLGSWLGDEEANRIADREVAPHVGHTHIDWNTCMGPLLEEKLGNLWKAGYDGYYSVEHHTGQDEYSEVAIQLAMVRRMLEKFRDGGMTG